MKKSITIIVILATLTLMLATSFRSDSHSPYQGRQYSPLFMTRTELEKSVKYVEGISHDIEDPAKIYVRGEQIFVSERYKGVHIIDNSDPGKMQRTGFITAPGCVDIAVKGNIIYLDNAVDLVAFDLVSKKVTERLVGLLPEPVSPNGDTWENHDRPKNLDLICVGWKKRN